MEKKITKPVLMSDVKLGYCAKCGTVLAQMDVLVTCPVCRSKLSIYGILFEKPPLRK